MTGTYERELERVRKARAEFEATQDEVERRKQDYFTAVQTLHAAGMPLREIASALGLSHQRVHQMVDEAASKKSALRRRIAKQGGLAMLVVVLSLSGFALLERQEMPQPVAGNEAPEVECTNEVLEIRVHKAPKPFLRTCAERSMARQIFEIQSELGRRYGDLVIEVREDS